MDSGYYREQIIDLYENPLNYGELETADFAYEEDNPLCGDVVRIEVKLDENGRVAQAAWSGEGCTISQISASLLTEEIKGKTLAEIKEFPREKLLAMVSELTRGPLITMRTKCAILPLKALQSGANTILESEEMRPE